MVIVRIGKIGKQFFQPLYKPLYVGPFAFILPGIDHRYFSQPVLPAAGQLPGPFVRPFEIDDLGIGIRLEKLFLLPVRNRGITP